MKNLVTLKRAVELQCWACLGFYSDGKQDCQCTKCSLYPWMPYREMEPNLDIFEYSPRRVGKVLQKDSMTPARLKTAKENLKRAHD